MKTTLLFIVSLLISTFCFSQNVKQNKSAKMGNRHVKSSAKGGIPDNAIGFLSEGNLAYFSDSDSLFLEPLTPQLEALGVSPKDWKYVQNKLRKRWTLTNNADFKKAIVELNDEIFSKKKCIAVYAEYGGKGGQKAMTIYTIKVWDSLPE